MALSLAALCQAQEPTPPEELAKFDAFLGNWQGSGFARMQAGGEEFRWTSVATFSRILEGHFIQEDARVDLGEGVPAPLVFRTIYAWDAHPAGLEKARVTRSPRGPRGAPRAG